MFHAVESQCLKSLNIKIVLFIIKWLKSFCCYSSHEVLYGGHICNLYGDAVIVLAQCVLIKVLTTLHWLVIAQNSKICTVQVLK